MQRKSYPDGTQRGSAFDLMADFAQKSHGIQQ
jgi:hypothetical protein